MDEIHHNISWGKYLLDSTHNPSGQLNVMEFCPRINEDLIARHKNDGQTLLCFAALNGKHHMDGKPIVTL